MSEPIEIPDFLEEAERQALLDELVAASTAASTLMNEAAGGVVNVSARRSKRVTVSEATAERVRQRLLAAMAPLAEHFGAQVSTCEAPQFLRYDEGDFFVPHQDGNTPLVHDDSRFRRISAVIFLSPRSEEPAPGTYGGGDHSVHGRNVRQFEPTPASGTPGTLVAFPTEETHEVTPVTHGVRFTIAAWYR